MCVKLPLEDLNPNPYPPHPTSTYTYGVTVAPRVCGGKNNSFFKKKKLINLFKGSFVDLYIFTKQTR